MLSTLLLNQLLQIPGFSLEADSTANNLPDTASQVPDSIVSPVAAVAEEAAPTIENVKTLLSPESISNLISSLISFGIKVGVAILVALVGKFIIQRIFKFVKKALTRRNTEPSLVTFILSFIKISLYFILIVIVIGILGVQTSSFIAIFASAGVAVGMALSGTLQNFAGGVLILLLKPYKVGDFIEAQGYTGTVKEIQIFNTIITTPDNKSIIIPNGGLSTDTINNYSKENYRRVDWVIGVAYGTDFDVAKKVILDILKSDNRVLRTPAEPFVAINELADSSVNLTVRAWALSSDYWDIYFEMNQRFYAQLPKNGIEFPFPQVDVHMS